MDTKLKNNHKIGGVIVAVLLVICTGIMLSSYPYFQMDSEKWEQHQEDNMPLYMWGWFMEDCFAINNQGAKSDPYDYEASMGKLEEMMPFMSFQVLDSKGDVLKGNTGDLSTELESPDSAYAIGSIFRFDEAGEISDIQIIADEKIVPESHRDDARVLAYQSAQNMWNGGWSSPMGQTYVFAMTEESIYNYLNYAGIDISITRVWEIYELMNNVVYLGVLIGIMLLLLLAGLLLPINKSLGIGSQKLFHASFEVVMVILCLLVSLFYGMTVLVNQTINGEISGILEKAGITDMKEVIPLMVNALAWFLCFGIFLWAVLCLKDIFLMGRGYWKERLLVWNVARAILKWCKRVWGKMKSMARRQYEALVNLDFQDKSNRMILKIIGLNFLVLMVICCFWFAGFFGLIIYSIALFVFLKKYIRDVQGKYQLLLNITNEMAEGNLDVSLEENLGLFEPIKTEIQKIQRGFKTAVEQEVKSQRMKTELVTNVSHDLKTPLTAIITYVDLLKGEQDEKKRGEYLGVLERKSLRLKALIEDLFEISKASSNNVVMNYMDVDLAGLVKQVELEYENKLNQAGLDVRLSFPGEKTILWLDSQKTYRVVENLIQNITKYALSGTRVYIDGRVTDEEYVLCFRNISAGELNFNADEITERFVRGDDSRNTEGSGLGLAIAKSFTQLQGGRLNITTEADLFKAEIAFPLVKFRNV